MPDRRTPRPSASLLCALGLALGTEAAALLLLAADQVLPALAWHSIAALSCALAGQRAARGTPEARPELAALVTGSLVFALPGVGLLGLVWVVLPRITSPRRVIAENELELPAFHEHESFAFDTERGFAAIEDELAPERPVEHCVQSVMALRRMDPKRAVPLLRIALGDPSEDVRLLAYAILERREKQIRARITHALAELREVVGGDLAQTDSAQLARLRGLANDHWELVYGEFSDGDSRALNLAQAARWAEAALRAQFDGTTAMLLARVRLQQSEPEAAWQLIVAAERAGVATGVCAPLLAEAAFLMRKFDAIPRLLARVADDPMHSARLEPVARFWTERSAS